MSEQQPSTSPSNADAIALARTAHESRNEEGSLNNAPFGANTYVSNGNPINVHHYHNCDNIKIGGVHQYVTYEGVGSTDMILQKLGEILGEISKITSLMSADREEANQQG